MGRSAPVALIVGAGSTGAATAHDLALRGFKVVVVERGEIASGTTGRNHGMLHSGGRYCVGDQEAAVECMQENMILRHIMPQAFELNGGLFIALNEDDMAYKGRFLTACEASGIPFEELTPEQALRLEPRLNPALLAAVRVPDGVYEPFRFCLSFLATAKRHGAEVRPYTEVVDLLSNGRGHVKGVRVRDRAGARVYDIEGGVVVNATGPWAGDVAAFAGLSVPVRPTPGVMVSMNARVCNLVINRLNKPGDGDIIIPQRQTSIIGTTSWPVDHADYIPVPEDHVRLLLEKGADLVPEIRRAHQRGVFAVARPLIGTAGVGARELSRTFECFDHARDGMEGFVTITGGKTTTARAMAEKTADVVCGKLGVDSPCRTRETPLASYREYYG